jgi:hypothetical protein
VNERIADTVSANRLAIVREDLSLRGVDIENETRAMGEIELDLPRDITLAILGRTNFGDDVRREARQLF